MPSASCWQIGGREYIDSNLSTTASDIRISFRRRGGQGAAARCASGMRVTRRICKLAVTRACLIPAMFPREPHALLLPSWGTDPINAKTVETGPPLCLCQLCGFGFPDDEVHDPIPPVKQIPVDPRTFSSEDSISVDQKITGGDRAFPTVRKVGLTL